MPTCLKSSGDEMGIPDGCIIIIQLGDPVTPVVPLGTHASTSPILSQRYPSISGAPRASSKLWDMSDCLVHVYFHAVNN